MKIVPTSLLAFCLLVSAGCSSGESSSTAAAWQRIDVSGCAQGIPVPAEFSTSELSARDRAEIVVRSARLVARDIGNEFELGRHINLFIQCYAADEFAETPFSLMGRDGCEFTKGIAGNALAGECSDRRVGEDTLLLMESPRINGNKTHTLSLITDPNVVVSITTEPTSEVPAAEAAFLSRLFEEYAL